MYMQWHRSPSWYLLPGGISVLLLEPYEAYGIPLLKERRYYTYLSTATSLRHLTGSLRIHKAYPHQESNQGYRHPLLMSILTEISQNDMDPDQISPTDVDPRPIISSRHRISPLWRRNQSKPTWTLTKYLQKTLGLPQSPSGRKHLCSQMTRFLPAFSNRLRGPMNCL